MRTFAGFAFEKAEHNRLAQRPATTDLSFPLVRVHEASLTTDEGFVRFNGPGHFVNRSGVHRVADSVEHEPCRRLRDAEISSDFVGTDSVLAVTDEPHRGKPFVQLNGAILENRTDFNRELLATGKARPHQARLEKRQLLTGAFRALWAVRPLRLSNSFKADQRVRKVLDCFNQTTLTVEFICTHDSTIHPEAV